MTKREPWVTPPVHPAADKLPMMSDAELAELAADIAANGLQQPIILWRDNREAANGSEGPFPLWLLDGRNRLAALKLLGIEDPNQAPGGQVVEAKVCVLHALQEGALVGGNASRTTWRVGVNPTVFVLSMNVHRRHLTSEQKRDAISAYIKADPMANNSRVAKGLGVSDKTVASVRDDLERRSEIPNVSERTDSAGRRQPARKPKPKKKADKPADLPDWLTPPKPDAVMAEPVEEPMPEPPGGLTENTPGQTDRVRQALEKVSAKPQEPAVEPEVVEPKPEPPGGVTPNTPGMTPAVQKALADSKAAQATPPEAAQPEEAPAEEVPAQAPGARTVDELVQVLVDATVALEALTEGWEDPDLPPMPILPFTAGAGAVVDSVCQRLWDVRMALFEVNVSSVIDRAVKPRNRRRGRPPKHKPPFDHKPPLTIAEDGSLAFPDVSAG